VLPAGIGANRDRYRLDTLIAESPVTIIVAIVVAVIGFALGFFVGQARRREAPTAVPAALARPPVATAPVEAPHDRAGEAPVTEPASPSPPPAPLSDERAVAERARIIRSYEGETAFLRRELTGRDATIEQLAELADERRRLFDELAAARTDTARYRQLVIDLENNAAPQFFGAGAPDDLKLIVGVGPVLERMLQMMGVTTYRQIARWSERDIDEFDAKLHEFPGRIRRDAWVTQARALHQSKYGEALSLRGRG
jgi:predicted flap endonuclease-1-like 5' DNA nuclease